jgi:hypothetical protein
MAKQSLLWTALPNGYAPDGKSLRVTVLVSPRLDAEADPEQLGTFPDFEVWPATVAKSTFTIRYGGAVVVIAGNDTASPSRVDASIAALDPDAWTALLPKTAFVEGFEFEDMTAKQVLSFPAANIDALVQSLYTSLAASAGEQLPTVSDFFADPGWRSLVENVGRNDSAFADHDMGVRSPRRQFEMFAEDQFKQLPAGIRDLSLLQLFHTPPSTPQIDGYDVGPDDPRSRAHWLGYRRTPLPAKTDFEKTIDFHQIVSAMNQYPTLLRRLGLAIDFIVAKGVFTPAANAELRVEVKLPPPSPKVTRAPDVGQRTRTLLDATHFQAVPRTSPGQGDYRVVDRLLEMDPRVFTLLQSDVDGAGLKVMNFARSLALMQPLDKRHDPVSKHERHAGAPSLRNVGFQLVHIQRAAMLKNAFKNQQDFNTKATSGAAPVLFAEDTVRGFRIDIWDGTTGEWRSLCRRIAHYDLNAGQVIVDVPEEEGIVRLAATKSSDESSNPDLLWLHEALTSWSGWSLCAPLPGKTIRHHRDGDKEKDHQDEVAEPEAEVPPGLRLATAFTVLPGSLPRLRYGRAYWIRARAVDLAGNSLAPGPKDFGPEVPSKNARTYFRYDPISAPAITLMKRTDGTIETPAEGESMELIAVRTFNDTPPQNTIPSTQRARRGAVPPRTTQREAEQHGLLDRNGIMDPAFFAMLAAKDESLPKELIKMKGPLADAETPAVETAFAVWPEDDPLPYLPEPLAVTVAARIFGLPGFPPDKIIEIPMYPGGAAWPDAAPFKIELYEKPGDLPRFDAATRTLLIPLPKAERARLRLSVMPTKEARGLMGVWSWLTAPQKAALDKMSLRGQHWMLTPWRHVDLVHATQRPLVAPDIVKHTMNRGLRSTFAMPTFLARCGISSTSHLDLLAVWNEPTEDTTSPAAGANRERNDRAYQVKISEPAGYAGRPDYLPEGDLIRTGGFFSDRVEKKIHEFHDTRYRRIEYHFDATTKFREFMQRDILTNPVGADPDDRVPTDEHIKVTGSTLRTWVPSSAPPPAPEVLYVVPTFGWVRGKDQDTLTSWRRGGGLRVYLNRPWNVTGYGEMLAVVVPSAAFAGDPMTSPATQPLKNFVTQWGNDPVWLSPFVSGVSPKRASFPLARTAPDPTGAWLPPFAPPAESDQDGAFPVTDLPHPEQRVSNAQTNVEVAPHDVFFDPDRRLWYCDIEVDWGTSYYPFIRLALARYQPTSLPGAHLSNIVLTDFSALAPDRWLNVTAGANAKTRRVRVFGHAYTDSSPHQESITAPQQVIRLPDGTVRIVKAPDVAATTVVEVWVERFDPALGKDFGWTRDATAVVTKDAALPKAVTFTPAQKARTRTLLKERQFAVLVKEGLIGSIFVTPTLWSGSVTLPAAPGGSTRYRLAIAEYEEYLTDDATPYDPPPTTKDRRLVFIEHVEIAG